MKTLYFILYAIISLLIAYLVYKSNIVTSPFGFWSLGIVFGYILGFTDYLIYNRIKELNKPINDEVNNVR